MGKGFWALWLATAFANLGDGMFKFVLPILALRLTNSPSLIERLWYLLTFSACWCWDMSQLRS